ncbi:NAD(P)/FAD-dependent oxidoreductase [Clostridium oceanicum]|uniref:FAD-dependent oxidoreductase n=1 Tax=Clostridium oceanicum TaxID=1543 RepID=A0ABN1JLH4_9CLOT
MFNKLFSSGKIGTMELKNRFVVPPMVSMFTNEDGTATERFIRYYEEKAKGEFGLIITENYSINQNAGGFKIMGRMWNEKHMNSHKELVDRIHKQGSKICLQIYHAGRQTTSEITGLKPVAPSPIKDPTMPEIPKELTVKEILKIEDDFVNAALLGKKAGFDAVEIHGAHGYLINQFLSPFSNKRTDMYGGSFINRFRFCKEIIEKVRGAVGKDYPILIRLGAEELVEGGLNIDDTKIIAKMAENAGVDCVDITVGVYATRYMIAAPAAVKEGWLAKYTAELKKKISVPVIVVNRFTNPFLMEDVLDENKADFIALGRQSIADPHFPEKVKEGRFDEINKCIGCMQGCIGRQVQGKNISCLVNPLTGKEYAYDKKTDNPKKVMVIGAGPAGNEAAISSARAGHEVHLFEKSNKIGGQWLIAAIPPNKEELNSFTLWQKKQLEMLNVDVNLETEVTVDMVKKGNYDEVIVATGANPITPNIEGIEGENVVQANDVLTGIKLVGDRCVVIGGGLVGAETCEFLALEWHKVAIVEMLDEIIGGLEEGPRRYIMKNLKENNAEIYTSSKVKKITSDSVIIEKDGREITLECDSVVIAIGSSSDNKLARKLENEGIDIKIIGDAKKAGRALDGVLDGFKVGYGL